MGGDRELDLSRGYSMWKAGILWPSEVLSQMSLFSFRRDGSGGWNSIASMIFPMLAEIDV